jgi:hypothetical protein
MNGERFHALPQRDPDEIQEAEQRERKLGERAPDGLPPTEDLARRVSRGWSSDSNGSDPHLQLSSDLGAVPRSANLRWNGLDRRVVTTMSRGRHLPKDIGKRRV